MEACWHPQGRVGSHPGPGIPPKPPLGGYAYVEKGLLSRKRSFRYPSARERGAALGGSGRETRAPKSPRSPLEVPLKSPRSPLEVPLKWDQVAETHPKILTEF